MIESDKLKKMLPFVAGDLAGVLLGETPSACVKVFAFGGVCLGPKAAR